MLLKENKKGTKLVSVLVGSRCSVDTIGKTLNSGSELVKLHGCELGSNQLQVFRRYHWEDLQSRSLGINFRIDFHVQARR